ncbi:MAG: pyridoxal 5'-phosphate synthase glutaminase subunit PdxT [Sporolactobacillus sp.]|jgi:5'-phosphate synthase pdxT subunit|nr:pyridoxal 5'-phosphate synthase glutaminase subunit PdxT [Sporolactobacillus sp.]
MTVKIGVLALQGAVGEHLRALRDCQVKAVAVKHAPDLDELDGLIIPGGESTTMRRLMDQSGLFETIRTFAATRSVFGTCAGMILLAKRIEGRTGPHLGLMDIDVKRNAFGRQVDSFEAELEVTHIGRYNGIFIRAPYILQAGKDVEVLATYDGHIVACRQGRFLACAFHPELTDNVSMHRYFVDIVRHNAEH